MNALLSHLHYYAAVLLLLIGLYTVIAHGNLVRKLIGMSIFQSSVFLLYISLGYRVGGTPPILLDEVGVYASPLPHVLILTAIVVGISTTALGLALLRIIHRSYGSLEESAIQDSENSKDSETAQ